MSTLFGPAGNSDSFTSKYKSSAFAPQWLAQLGLGCYEYQCGRGINIGEDTARRIGAQAQEHGIRMSLHSPYYINLSSEEPERVAKNCDYIVRSARVCDWLGGDRVVVHCGGLSGKSREVAMQSTLHNLRHSLAEMESEGLSHITLCIETMGKKSVLGNFDEVMQICQSDERLLPCIDFGHLNARDGGSMCQPDAVERLLCDMENRLGAARAKMFHAHFSKIEYSSGGEVRHLTFDDQEFGPPFEPLCTQLAKGGYSARIICESAGTQAEDALRMMQFYQAELLKKC